MKLKFFIQTIAMCMISLTSVHGASSRQIKVPTPLHEGSRIALITPASAHQTETIDSAIVKLREHGFEPVVMKYTYGNEYGSYPASDEDRASDIMEAFTNDSIDAILCTRGGYGTVRLLPLLDKDVIYDNPKWLIGYSDISVLHAYMYHAGVASIHGPMTSHIAYEPDSLEATQYLYHMMSNPLPMRYKVAPSEYNKSGKARGRLVGGNLMCINGLAQTPYDIMTPEDSEDIILFIEDVGEKIYAIERVLMRMHLDGTLKRIKGLIIGQFTEYSPSKDFNSMEDMIHYWLKKWGYYDKDNPMPIVFDFPVGHVSDNYPMPVGVMTELTVGDKETVVTFVE